MTQEDGTLAARLTHLINTVHPPDRGPYSYREISAGVLEKTGHKISYAFINDLARGEKRRVSTDHVQALATFFGVPVAYFFDDEMNDRINSELEALVEWRDERAAEARQQAERIMSLSPQGRQAVASFIESLDAYEQTPRDQRPR